MRLEVEKDATPDPLSTPVPIGVAPSRKVTVPVGIPTPGAIALTVTVNVTDCPGVLGLTDETRDDEVFALFTVKFALPLLPVCVALPP